jgi:hypothetical protein
MEKLKRLPDPFTEHILPTSRHGTTRSDSKVAIADTKVARLLLVLHEIDQAVAGLESLPQTELTELVSSAIIACGFVDGTEARRAIVTVLEAIERRDPTPQSC